MSEDYDVVVIGAGIMGLSTAWHLVHKERVRVLVLEQWPLPHQRGSSSGHGRIYRRTYEEVIYQKMMSKAMELWREIETISKNKLLYTCGLLLGGKQDVIHDLATAMADGKIDHEVIQYRDLKKQYPHIKNFKDDEDFLFDPHAGLIAAQDAMSTLQDLITEFGGEIKTREKVISIESAGGQSKIQTNLGTYFTKAVVVTIGPWIAKFLQSHGIHLPLKTQKTAVCYFKMRLPEKSFRITKHPVFSYCFNSESDLIYSTPDFEYSEYVKFAHHHAVDADPDLRDMTVYPQSLIENVSNYVQRHFPQFHPKPAIVEYCMYTMSPDDNFVIDRHPILRNCVIGAGFSGHGFKMAPTIGQLLGELAVGKEPSVDCSMFRIDRFKAAKL